MRIHVLLLSSIWLYTENNRGKKVQKSLPLVESMFCIAKEFKYYKNVIFKIYVIKIVFIDSHSILKKYIRY